MKNKSQTRQKQIPAKTSAQIYEIENASQYNDGYTY